MNLNLPGDSCSSYIIKPQNAAQMQDMMYQTYQTLPVKSRNDEEPQHEKDDGGAYGRPKMSWKIQVTQNK